MLVFVIATWRFGFNISDCVLFFCCYIVFAAGLVRWFVDFGVLNGNSVALIGYEVVGSLVCDLVVCDLLGVNTCGLFV